MIWLGPAGVPGMCRKRDTISGIRCVAELGLNAMEVEFVRGITLTQEAAGEASRVAKELGVRLSVHCPYFVNLCSPDRRKVEASKMRILESVRRAHAMGADIAVFHPGYYGGMSSEQAGRAVASAITDMISRMEAEGLEDVHLGLETTGKVTAFGTLDEIISICREFPGCRPVIDFAHIYARQGGRIDFAEIFEKLRPMRLDHLHTHFTAMEWKPAGQPGTGNERRHLPMRAGDPQFRPLAEEILRRRLSITIIAESPVLELDSLEMKKVFEQLGHRFDR